MKKKVNKTRLVLKALEFYDENHPAKATVLVNRTKIGAETVRTILRVITELDLVETLRTKTKERRAGPILYWLKTKNEEEKNERQL